ncbi:MAG: hypothetical protein E6G79_01420 [Alphaproteobacteria bacterium]|nr:MAG: hypothetical protein E6G79_01420 [Alphaproteobacteria bacterium]
MRKIAIELVLHWRIAMKSVALLVAFCAFCAPALAQTSECQSVAKPTNRLACYDKAMPPSSKAKPAASLPVSSTQPGQMVDLLAAENARLDAKINSICRGC